MEKPVPVTYASVPDKRRFLEYVEDILETRWFTNGGRYVRAFEKRLGDMFDAPLSVCANGTLALQLAIRAAGLSGKTVVTTPFTYVASLSALLWEGCTPIFADIDEHTLCLSPESLASLDLSRAEGLLPVHPYGNACDVDALQKIASEASLFTIYDAAQAFGCVYKGRPLVWYGDLSIISFHATKLVHSIEGGCVICHSEAMREKVNLLRSFGHIGDEHYDLGINAKMSEMHAAMGLCTLDDMDENIAGRGNILQRYSELLDSKKIQRPRFSDDLIYSNQYFPIIFESESVLLKVVSALNKENIQPRRYFYPSLTELPYISRKGTCPVAEDISRRVLCLPVYKELEEATVERIAGVVLSVV